MIAAFNEAKGYIRQSLSAGMILTSLLSALCILHMLSPVQC